MNPRGPIQDRSSAGFTLVEIALALLVVSIGMMGILALLPAGLQSGKDAADDSRIALMAEGVLDDLRMEMDRQWSDSASGYVYSYGGFTDIQLNRLVTLNEVEGAGNPRPFCRCYLKVSNVVPGRMLEAKLSVWPGYRGDPPTTSGTERKLVFYTRIVNKNL